MKKAHILLIEDNEGDILLATEAFEDRDFVKKIDIARDGEKALNYLFNKASHKTQPDLIILDINIPKKSGHEVLLAIREDEHYNHIPVIMMSTSSSEKDKEMAYLYKANHYITKPVDMDAYHAVVNFIEAFWNQWNVNSQNKRS